MTTAQTHPPRPQHVSAALRRAGLDSASRGLSGYQVRESYVPAGAVVRYSSKVQASTQHRTAMLCLYLRALKMDGYLAEMNAPGNAVHVTGRNQQR